MCYRPVAMINVSSPSSELPSGPPSSLTEFAQERLRKMIVSGVLKPGAKIPVQRLATEFGISRTPVRDAAWQLSVEGLVEIRARVGIYVRPIPAEEILEVHRIKRALEPLLAAWAADRATPSERNVLRLGMAALGAAADRGDVAEYVRLLEQRSVDLTIAAHAPVVGEVFGFLDGRIRIMRYRNLSQPGSLDRSIGQHRRIASAIMDGDSGEAYAAMAEHLLDGERRVRELLALTAARESDNQSRVAEWPHGSAQAPPDANTAEPE